MEGWVPRYTGIPYLLGGTCRKGLDCLGLVRLVYREQFLEEVAGLGEGWSQIECKNWKYEEGDVVVLNIYGLPVHCGIAVSPTQFLHAMDGRVSGVESLSDMRWRKRIRGYYRHGRV